MPSIRLSDLDITLGTGAQELRNWQGGASDGQTLWFLNDPSTPNGTARIRAWNAATRQRDIAKDFNLGSVGVVTNPNDDRQDVQYRWTAIATDGTTMWAMRETFDEFFARTDVNLRAYNLITKQRDFSRESTLTGISSRQGMAVNSGNLWLLEVSSPTMATATPYSLSTLAANTANNIDLGSGDWRSIVSDGGTLWFVDSSSSQDVARAYDGSSRMRDAGLDITLGSGAGVAFFGGASDGETVWFAEEPSNIARAYRFSRLYRDGKLVNRVYRNGGIRVDRVFRRGVRIL